jgi:hypothetical protein
LEGQSDVPLTILLAKRKTGMALGAYKSRLV